MNQLTDKDIRDLLRQRLLEDESDSILSKTLTDMESVIAFSGDYGVLPALAGEKALLSKLQHKLTYAFKLKWALAGIGTAAAVGTGMLAFNSGAPEKGKTVTHIPAVTKEIPRDSIVQTDSIKTIVPFHTSPDYIAVPEEMPQLSFTNPLDIKVPVLQIPELNPSFPDKNPGNIQYSYAPVKSSTEGPDIKIDTIFKGIKSIEVEGLYCDISVKAITGSEIKLKGNIHSESKGLVIGKSSYQVNYNTEGDKLKITVSGSGKSRLIAGSIDLQAGLNFEVPAETNVHISCSGNITLEGLKGTCIASTGYGDIKADNINTDIQVKSASGKIIMNSINGNVDCHASYGDTRFNTITGNIVVKNSSGNVELNNLMGNAEIKAAYGNITVKNAEGTMTINASSGNINLENISGGKSVIHSTYGDIRITQAKNDLAVQSTSGHSILTGITGNVQMASSYGNQSLSDIKGNVALTSSSGKISINTLKGNAELKALYGDISLNNCTGDLKITSQSGNISAAGISLLSSATIYSSYGNIKMSLQNKAADLSFDLEASYGNIKVNKDSVKGNAENGKLQLPGGPVTIKAYTASGNQTFD